MNDDGHSHEQPPIVHRAPVEVASSPVPSASPRQLRWIRALTTVLSIALVDAAIETFITGSGVRWVTLGFVTLTLFAGFMLRRRLTAAAAAWGALLALLGLVAITSWMPGGATAGVVVMHQSTSRVITFIVALGVLYSAYLIGKLTFVPLPGKATLGLLALYAVSALAAGAVFQTPYPALLRGESVWRELPFWLQGAFLGALVVVPVGLLAALAGAARSIRRSELRKWATQTMALVLVFAVALSGVTVPRGELSQSVSAKYAPPPAPDSSEPAPAPAQYEEAIRELDGATSIVRSLAALVDPAMIDVTARARRLGSDIDTAFSFVRDSIRFEPYSGLLRGAHGTLLATAGNALDRSLLLAALLDVHGIKTRVARGTLSPAHVATLAQRWSATPPPVASVPEEKVLEIVEAAGQSSAVREARRMGTHAKEIVAWVSQRAAVDAGVIRSALGPVSAWFTDTASARVQAQLQDHFWLQAERNGRWVDLDTAFPDSTVGQRFTDSTASFGVRDLPRDLVHAVRLSMTVERAGPDGFERQVVLDRTIQALDLATGQIHLSNGPVGRLESQDLSGANTYRADIRVGENWFRGDQYSVSGPSGRQGAVPDIGGALFGGASSGGTELSAVWLEIALIGPGRPVAAERRYLVDRVGREARQRGSSDTRAAVISDDAVRTLLVRDCDILVMPFAHPEFLDGYLLAQHLMRSQSLFRSAADVNYGRAAFPAASSPAEIPRFSPTLAAFGAAVSQHLRGRQGSAGLVLERPFVAMLRGGLAVTTVGDRPGSAAGLDQGFDIVSTGAIPFGGSAEERGERGLAFGTYLTSLELAFAKEQGFDRTSVVSNASSATEAAIAASQRVRALRASGDEAMATFPAEARFQVRANLAEGYLTVVPPPNAVPGGSFNWWRVDPGSAVALGIGETGEGQATAEQVLKAGATWVSAVVCVAYSSDKHKNNLAKARTAFWFCLAAGAFGGAAQLGADIFYWILAWSLGICAKVAGIL